MRGRKRLRVAGVVAALALAGGYAGLWWVLARNLEAGFVEWAQEARASRLDLAWDRIAVGGFPFALRVDLSEARLADHAVDPPLELRAPILAASATPWDFRVWQFKAPRGITGEMAGSEERPPLHFATATAAATFWARPEGGATVWLRLRDASASAGGQLRAAAADVWLTQPPNPPRADSDPLVAAALDLRALDLSPIAGAGGSIDEVSVAATLKGPFPAGPLRQSAAAWRDAGGTLDLEKLRLAWGTLAASASGTLALDRQLQPEGALSGAVEGFDQLIGALVRSGLMPAKNAGLAKLALMVLAKAGPDGRPRLATSLRIQDGQMFLGPARLGRVPHIAWQ